MYAKDLPFWKLSNNYVEPPARANCPPVVDRHGQTDEYACWAQFRRGIKRTKRKVRRLAGGALYFGSTPLPIPLHGKDNCQHGSSSEESPNPAEDSPADLPKSTKAVGGEDVTSPPTASVDVPLCPHEGVSFTKVSRGDWMAIELFMLGLQGWHVANDGQLRAKGET